ncbi:unnamed protein product, partial [Polarella glacialis]
ESRRAPASTFYLLQHKDFGNACGTIAAVHAIGSLARSGACELTPGSAMERFLLAVAGKDPAEIGWDLADASELHEVSEAAARSIEAQTQTPGRQDKVDGHFVVFVAVEGRLVELDGCMGFPIDHGPLGASGEMLKEAARVIREEFMSRAPGNPNFSVMALSSEDVDVDMMLSVGQGAADEAKVQMLVSMGFAETAAREALLAACGDEQVATELLCG